ncbi:MAG: energy-coupled thiamine transporter ThiT [Clostridia bacterium]|nr:energy-coupled thiamine transporter ThiT [Clostridia bacterium]
MKTHSVRRLTTTAVLIAISVVLAFLSDVLNLRLPFGGSVTLASMLPLVVIAYLYGTRWGLASAFCYSLLQLLVLSWRTVSAFFIPESDSYMILWQALLICVLDYLVAYTVIGFAGFTRKFKKQVALPLGALLGVSLRYVTHIVSGALFYGAWAEWFFAEGSELPAEFNSFFLNSFSGAGLSVAYSAVYNGLYMIPEIVITALAAAAIAFLPQIKKELD